MQSNCKDGQFAGCESGEGQDTLRYTIVEGGTKAIPHSELSPFLRRLRDTLPSVFAEGAPIRLETYDGIEIGSLEQLYFAANMLNLLGTKDPTKYTGVSGGGGTTFTATVTGSSLAVGVLVEWSVTADDRRLMSFGLATSGFVAVERFCGNSTANTGVDRIVQVEAVPGCPGGRIFLPFAYRSAAMQNPQVRIGAAAPVATPGDPRAATVVAANVPASATSFAMTATLITAHSTQLSDLLRLARLRAER